MFRISLSIFVTCKHTCVSVFNSRLILRTCYVDRDSKSVLEKKNKRKVFAQRAGFFTFDGNDCTGKECT